MVRVRASLIHLLISALLLSVCLGVVFFFWYPTPYFQLDGGWTVIQMLIAVDLVLGPLLTLIVYKPSKPSLRFDLGCIALLQIGALGYGLQTIYAGKPDYLVWSVDRFVTVAASEIDAAQLRYPQLKSTPLRGPKPVLARLPDDREARTEILLGAVGGGRDLEHLARYYEPYRVEPARLAERGVDIETVAEHDAEAKRRLQTFLAERDAELDEFYYLPLVGKQRDGLMAVSRSDGAPVGAMLINPWASITAADTVSQTAVAERPPG